jgi:hypothetical protein
MTITKDVELLQAGQPASTLSILAGLRQGIGNCE